MKKLWIHLAVDAAGCAVMFALLGPSSIWAGVMAGVLWARLVLSFGAIDNAKRHCTVDELASLSLTDIIKRGTRPSVESLHAESIERQTALRDLLNREATRLRATAQRQANETGKTHAYQVAIGGSLTFETVDPEEGWCWCWWRTGPHRHGTECPPHAQAWPAYENHGVKS